MEKGVFTVFFNAKMGNLYKVPPPQKYRKAFTSIKLRKFESAFLLPVNFLIHKLAYL